MEDHGLGVPVSAADEITTDETVSTVEVDIFEDSRCVDVDSLEDQSQRVTFQQMVDEVDARVEPGEANLAHRITTNLPFPTTEQILTETYSCKSQIEAPCLLEFRSQRSSCWHICLSVV